MTQLAPQTQNTPGYSVRTQIAFAIRDGVTRAYMLTEIGGAGRFVEIPLETAKSWVEHGQADEFQYPTLPPQFGRQVSFVEVKGACGCQHKERTSPVGRLLGSDIIMVGEPVFAVAEGDEGKVACMGAECDAEEIGEGSPRGIRFDRYAVADDGGYELRDSVSSELPENLINRYSKRAPACLPWVRVTRDPRRFRTCLAKAREIGPMSDSEAVYKLVGDHLVREDQEVFLAILVDVQLHVRAISEIARGSRDRTAVSIPDTLRVAIVEGVTGIIVCHNHPSAVARPSEADIELTRALAEACKKVQLSLLDHVIVGGGSPPYYSFSQHNKL
jgi:hypothetical protein